MKKVLSILLYAVMILTLLVGCAGGPDSGGSASESPSTSDAAGSEETLRIGFSLITQQYPYYVTMLEGIQSACESKGWEFVYADAGTDVEKTVNDCLDLIQQDIDVLVIASWYGDSLSDVFEKCKQADIPVFLIDTGGLPEDGDYVTNIGTDNYDAGYIGGYWTAKYFLDEGKDSVKLLTFTTVTNVGSDRVDGFIAGLEAGGLTVDHLNNYLGDTRESYMSSCEDALTAYQEVDLIYGANAQAGLGSYDSCVAAGRSNIKIVGFDAEDEEVQLIDSGTQYIASVKQLPAEMAQQTIQNIEDYLYNGATFDKSTPFESGVYSVDGFLTAEDILG